MLPFIIITSIFSQTTQWTFTPETMDVLDIQNPVFAEDSVGGGLIFDGKTSPIEVKDKSILPTQAFSISTWVSIDTPSRWGGVIGCVQDNNDVELGWILGYNETQFTIGLSTVGSDDGNGMMTYLDSASTTYEIGKWYFVSATYDGSSLKLFVNGKLCNVTNDQHGNIAYNKDMPFVIGGYQDDNELNFFDGRIQSITLNQKSLSASQIDLAFDKNKTLSEFPVWHNTRLDWEVKPYLNWPTTEKISVSFETTIPTDATLEVWHETGCCKQTVQSHKNSLHHFRLDGLEANQKYFYLVRADDSLGNTIESERLSFRTAPNADDSFTFIAIGDTQSQAEVVKRISDLAFMHRPNLIIHAGDLVTTGTNKTHWTNHFFPAMQPLISRVPFMPVLGNHEQDAQHYYDYMDLPQPEMYYSFIFGSAEFFMIDGNRKLSEGSKQLKWLEGALSQSIATWKFAVLHQPPYTSDSNDYGDTYRTTSTRGDTNVKNIISLLEKYGVDICFSGHVHDYERTFPILNGKVTPLHDGGVMYVTTAGGGGYLEHFDPTNTWFGHKKANYHHLVYIAIHGKQLEFQAIDEYGQLFDVITINK